MSSLNLCKIKGDSHKSNAVTKPDPKDYVLNNHMSSTNKGKINRGAQKNTG